MTQDPTLATTGRRPSPAPALLAAALLAAPTVHAADWPNAPDEDPREAQPNDPGYDGQWNLWSWVPSEWASNEGFREEEKELGTGIHADRAWQVTTGRRDTIVAVLDSGAEWDSKDLVAKYHLNRGELGDCKPEPLDEPPEGADAFDVNGSGHFDIRDYLATHWPEGEQGTLWDRHQQANDAYLDANPDHDLNDNGLLDPGDLIRRCEDGVDDDDNGYVDDISGWDFFADDNNPYDTTRFGHGDGEAKDSTAEGNNGRGSIGVCPDCTPLMVRVGDSFVVDANDFAQGVLFAVDSGASVIQEALGSINNTPFAEQAIDYAYDNNTVVIASAADELSFHHNFPGSNPHTVYVHAIQYDGSSPSESTTFLNFNNCTNYGIQLDLSTPGVGCSSEATGISAGHAGLVYAAAAQEGLQPPLSAEEAEQVMTHHVDDIDVAPDVPMDIDPTGDSDAEYPSKFPSDEGWDWHFGYGRNNARKTVDGIRNGHVPPVVDITSPRWFQVLYPDRQATVPVEGRINTRTDGREPRYDQVEWTLAYALGRDPAEDAWTTLSSGTTSGTEGELAEWDTSEVPLDLDAKIEDPHQNVVQLRLTATPVDEDGTPHEGPNGEPLTGRKRRGVLLERDPDLYEGFPKHHRASGEASPTFADLDDDGAQEIVVPTADGLVHAYSHDGGELEGFPAELDVRRALNEDNPEHVRGSCAFREDKSGCEAKQGTLDPDVRETVMMAPAVGDLEGDGDLEIVVASWDGQVYVFEHDGSRREGWPRSVNRELFDPNPDKVIDAGFFAAPVLVDLDGEPGLEILAAGMDQHLYAWHADGSTMDPYPVRVHCAEADLDRVPNCGGYNTDPSKGARIVTTPAVGDADDDGRPEIAVGTSETFGAGGNTNESVVYLLDARDGTIERGWPQSVFGLMVEVLPIVGKGVVSNPIMADLDFDGTLEINFDTISSQGVFFEHHGSRDGKDPVFAKMNNQQFGPDSDSADSPTYILMNHGAIANIDGRGGLDFVKGSAGFDFAVAFAGGGTRKPFDHHMSGWDTQTGEMMDAWPRTHDDWQFFNTPSVADLTNDGNPEVIVGSGGYLVHAWDYEGEEPEGWPKQTGGWIIASATVGDFDGNGRFDVTVNTRNGDLYVWRTEGKAGESPLEWNGFAHDPHNTNNYERPVAPYRTWEDNGGQTPNPDERADAAEAGDAAVADAAEPSSDAATGDTDDEADPPPSGGGGGGGCLGGPAPLMPQLALLATLLLGLRRRGATRG